MKKRCLFLFFSLVIVFCLIPLCAMAYDTPLGVWIGDTEFTENGRTIPCGNGTAKLEKTSDSYIIRLNDAAITADTASAGIRSTVTDKSISIILSGANSITLTGTSSSSCAGIQVNSPLSITSDSGQTASLLIRLAPIDDAGITSYGILCNCTFGTLQLKNIALCFSASNANSVFLSSQTIEVTNSQLKAQASELMLTSALNLLPSAENYRIMVSENMSGSNAHSASSPLSVVCPTDNRYTEILPKDLQYALWVGGIQVTGENKDHILGSAGSAAAAYDPYRRTLILSHADITAGKDATRGTGSRVSGGILSNLKPSVTIELQGENRIRLNNSLSTYGILSCDMKSTNYPVLLTGEGSLDITLNGRSGSQIGIGCSTLTLNGPSLSVLTQCPGYSCYALNSSSFHLLSGEVTLISDGSAFDSLSRTVSIPGDYQIYTGNSMTGKGAVITAEDFSSYRSNQYVRFIPPSAAAEYDIWVGGIRVNHLNRNNILDDETASAKFDPAVNRLTLNGAVITAATTARETSSASSPAFDCAVLSRLGTSLTVELHGRNVIDVNNRQRGYGIFAGEAKGSSTVLSLYNVNLIGDGSLDISVKASRGNQSGIRCSKLTIDGPSVSVFTQCLGYSCFSIYTTDVTLSDGALTARSSDSAFSSSGCTVSIPAGYLTVTGNEADGRNAAVTVEAFSSYCSNSYVKFAKGTLGDGWYLEDNGCLHITGAVTNAGKNRTPWEPYKNEIRTAVAEGSASINSCAYLFDNCTNLTGADLHLLNTDGVTDMHSMFGGCKNLTSLDLRGINTSGVTDMSYLFYLCSSLSDLDLRGFDTSAAEYLTSMFERCYSLTSLDLSSFETPFVEDMDCMFLECCELSYLDISRFSANSLRYSDSLFDLCEKLGEIVTNGDFLSAASEQFLDVSSFWMNQETGTVYRCAADLQAIRGTVTLLNGNFSNIALQYDNRAFSVSLCGLKTDVGIVMVALYDNSESSRLREIRIFDLAKGETPVGTFSKSGTCVKAMWLDAQSSMRPVCHSAVRVQEGT